MIKSVSIEQKQAGLIEVSATVDGQKLSMTVIEQRSVSEWNGRHSWNCHYAYATSTGESETSVYWRIASENVALRYLFDIAKGFFENNAPELPADIPQEEVVAL